MKRIFTLTFLLSFVTSLCLYSQKITKENQILSEKYGTLQFTLGGHIGTVTDVSWSPDGNQIVTVGVDHNAIIWDVASGAKIHILTGHMDDILSVAWSPDGSRIVTGSLDASAIIWDAATGEIQYTLRANHRINGVQWNFDGSRILTSSNEDVKIWDAATGNRMNILQGHTDIILSVKWSPDGSRIATGSRDKSVVVWDATTGTKIKTLQGHTYNVVSISWNSDGIRLASASDDRTTVIWNTVTGNIITTLTHLERIKNVSWSPDGKHIATISFDSTAVIWDPVNGAKIHTLKHPYRDLFGLIWSPDGSRLATYAYEYYAAPVIWDANSGVIVTTLAPDGIATTTRNLRWSPDGSRVVTANQDGNATTWDAATGKIIHIFGGHHSLITDLKWSPDGSKIATSSWDELVIVWNSTNGEKIHILRGHTNRVGQVNWSPDGSRLASTGHNEIIVWDAQTGDKIRTITMNTFFSAVDWSPNCEFFAVIEDTVVAVWDVKTGTKTHTLSVHNARVNSIYWNPDGSRIVMINSDSSVTVWDLNNNEKISTLGHIYTYLVSWSPDGRQIATAGKDSLTTIWDATSGEKILTFRMKDSLWLKSVTYLSWSPDGSRIAAVSYGNVSIWDIKSGQETVMNGRLFFQTVSWSRDGAFLLAACGESKSAVIWETRSGAILYIFLGHNGTVVKANWSPDENRIATVSQDYSAKVWYAADAVGVSEQQSVTDTSLIFPNPAGNTFTVQYAEAKIKSTEFQLFNIFGQLVIAGNIPPHTKEWNVNVESLPGGMYMLTIGNQTSKIVLYR